MKIHIFTLSIILALSLIMASCSEDSDIEQQAKRLAQQTIIVDGHIDVPYRLKDKWEDISQATEEGDFDYPRAKQGGLNAPFMAIYLPASYEETGGGKAAADSLIDMVEGFEEDYPDKYAVATSMEDIENHFEEGLISLPMGIENGTAIEDDIDNLAHFYDRGIRYMTLAHAEDNRISDSSYDGSYTHDGISDFGEEVIAEMNRLGMMVDVSHLSDDAFFDVMELSEAPVIASHSSARHFTPDFERNMNDEMIEDLAENDGIIMINFGSNFLEEESRESSDEVSDHISDWLDENDMERDDPEAEEYIENYRQENYKYSSVEKVADHIDHVRDLVGIDYIGLGSDYDGVGDTLPTGLKDASTYPNLFKELLERGYSEEDIEKISYKNFFRVWTEVNVIAEELQDNS